MARHRHLSSLFALAGALLAALAGPAVLSAQEVATRLRLPACYILSYTGDHAADSVLYAARVALGVGSLMGDVFSEGFPSDTGTAWRLFRGDAKWVPAEPDSVILLFHSAPTIRPDGQPQLADVRYDLAIRGDSLVGRARMTIYVGSHPQLPWINVLARRAACGNRARVLD